ncbi:MAG TPA: AAA family ATPase [Caulobacteraceae bacterium]
MRRVGVVDGAIGGPERFTSLAALFPHIAFESVGPAWPDRPDPRFDILIVSVSALVSAEIEAASRRLKAAGKVVVVLRDADVMTTRLLIREGAADVLTAPVSEPALAISLERLLASEHVDTARASKGGEVVAFLKAGGGVGATSLAVQLAALLASKVAGRTCVADLDLQFGAVGLYLDMPEAVTITDIMGAGQALDESPLDTALPAHRSNVQVLAAPRELTALESLSPAHVDGLMQGLRRNFALTLLELPSVWTAWTNQALHLADRVVLVTQLSVPHVNFVKRQLRMLATQGLDTKPLILVCNGLSSDQQATLSLKAAERAIGRGFDAVLPEDRRTMTAAINQGLQLSAVRRGTKLEKAIADLGAKVAAGVMAPAEPRARW